MSSITHTNDATFDQDTQGSTPVLVDFWAEWCGPCRMIAPVLEQLSAELGDRLRILKLNADENPHSLHRFGVTGIPTLILFKDGQPVERLVGFRPKPQLLDALQSHLDTATPAA